MMSPGDGRLETLESEHNRPISAMDLNVEAIESMNYKMVQTMAQARNIPRNLKVSHLVSRSNLFPNDFLCEFSDERRIAQWFDAQ